MAAYLHNWFVFFFSVFGIGSMIYSGIEIGMFFELTMDKNSNCSNLFSVIRPILQMIFVFVQMYFVFLNQKMNIYKNKFMSRFGLMHMIATNICVWLNVLILETDHEIKNIKGSSHHKRDAHEEMVTNFTTSANFWMKFDIRLLELGHGWFSFYLIEVVEILKSSLDSIPSPSPSVKIQIIGRKKCLRCKGKTLGVVNKLF